MRWSALALTVALAGCAPGPGGSPDPRGQFETYGWHLLERRCQGCHRLPDPRMHSHASWNQGITKMQHRMHLPQADWDTLRAMVAKDSMP